MSAIDQVIARARMAGESGFSERRQFKLARSRAIEKLRRFALANPYFYVLELIQAAVAGGAEFVDVGCGGGDITISWVGGALSEDELAQLFDFLFASKQRVDIAHVRSLALGVNAVLLFSPESVIIESGDGSAAGTARMVIGEGAEQVDVGRGEGRMAGTFVRVTGLDRAKVRRETGHRGDAEGSLEYGVIEQRCLTAPVPVMFNGTPLFGWSKQRVPGLFGYQKVRSFDEGDLYGTIGLNPSGGQAVFRLLTHGVWVQSYQHELIPNKWIGGVVCFDRLHKTVDHSGFVRDEVFDELWLRLLPYAEELVGARAVDSTQITTGEGLAYGINELRVCLREQPRAVVASPALSEAKVEAVAGIADRLDAQLLRAEADHLGRLRVLGGRELLLWYIDEDCDEDLRFYAQAELPPPGPASLLPVIELDPMTADKLLDLLAAASGTSIEEDERARIWRPALGESGQIQARLYTPTEPRAARRGLLVELTSTGRLLERRLFASAHPGRVLRVELPTAGPSRIRRQFEDRPLLWGIAERFAALCVPLLHEQDRRVLRGLGVGSIAATADEAKMALQVISRVTVTRLRGARPGRVSAGLSFSLLRAVTGFDPFAIPLLPTVSGAAMSLRALALLSDETGGLVYGRVPTVPADLEGLDTARILDLDEDREHTLLGLLGDSGYVRVDARDVLAEHAGLQVRDMAVGLRAYPDFPVLVEGPASALERLAALDAAGREALTAELVALLWARVLAAATGREEEEHRRQALRHLQWIACRIARTQESPDVAAELLELPLFLDLDGQAWCLRQVIASLQAPEGLLVYYAHVLGGAELGTLAAAVRGEGVARGGRPSTLAVSGFVYRLLVPLGRVRLAFDFDLDDLEAGHNPVTACEAFLVSDRFEASWGGGVLGVPARRLDEYRVQLSARERGAVGALDELARLYGLVGSIEIDAGAWTEQTLDAVVQRIDEQGEALLSALVARLPELAEDRQRYAVALEVLLTYVGEQLSLIGDHGGLFISLHTSLAERILGLPLFDIGGATRCSGERLVQRFRRHFESGGAQQAGAVDWPAILAKDTPAPALAWLDAHLQPARVILPASAGGEEAGGDDTTTTVTVTTTVTGALQPWPSERPLDAAGLAWNLDHWLERLRPDRRQPERGPAFSPTRVRIVEHALPGGSSIFGDDVGVEIHVAHPMVVAALADPGSRTLAWALLGLYGYINALWEFVRNSDEMSFQRVVAQALSSGELGLLEPPAGAAGGRGAAGPS
ncbi:hypothetical protein G6O69_23110 [Pseudenhygromyxa sp. WMMC2535]|uniref:hypothetical protein n=1 Tax=Pseudenhygromyxa sp. WMMC2535 TaxID=2712867 RepID=UPI001557B40F|nr:hypothetical protein [Pseudenhygromyxa sp. WMMC2535]NVB40748.1 hypothetical protein [Pseudenhygromyxa sp. WMMC2535]